MDLSVAIECLLNAPDDDDDTDDDDDNDDDDTTPDTHCDSCSTRRDCRGQYDCIEVPYIGGSYCATDEMDAAQCIMNPPDDDDDTTDDDDTVLDRCPVGECEEIQGYYFCLENGQPPANTPQCDINNPSCPEEGQVPVQAQDQSGTTYCLCLYDCTDWYNGDDDDDTTPPYPDTHCDACSTRRDCMGQYDCIEAPYIGGSYCATDEMDAMQCIMGGDDDDSTTCTPECSDCFSASECCNGLDCVEVPIVGGSVCATDMMGALQCMMDGGGGGGGFP